MVGHGELALNTRLAMFFPHLALSFYMWMWTTFQLTVQARFPSTAEGDSLALAVHAVELGPTPKRPTEGVLLRLWMESSRQLVGQKLQSPGAREAACKLEEGLSTALITQGSGQGSTSTDLGLVPEVGALRIFFLGYNFDPSDINSEWSHYLPKGWSEVREQSNIYGIIISIIFMPMAKSHLFSP